MNRHLIHIFAIVAAMAIALTVNALQAQTGHAEYLRFSETVHNFGKINIKAGPQSCAFEYTNVTKNSIVINNILSSCGCTEPKWSKAPIMPGEKGKIKVTFLNDQGPYPFDKTLTVYTSAAEKPIMLRITGVVYEKGKPLSEQYPAHFGPLGLRSAIQNGGQVEQGFVTTKKENVANLSKKSVTVSFTNQSKGFNVKISPSVIKPDEAATITYTIDTKPEENWGKTRYSANFVIDGKVIENKFVAECMIVTPYTSLSYADNIEAPQFMTDKSSLEFGKIKAGQTVNLKVRISNAGKSPLRIYKIEKNGTPAVIKCPAKVEAGQSGVININFTPQKKEKEAVFTITLITNVPNRPIVTLFLAGDVRD